MEGQIDLEARKRTGEDFDAVASEHDGKTGSQKKYMKRIKIQSQKVKEEKRSGGVLVNSWRKTRRAATQSVISPRMLSRNRQF